MAVWILLGVLVCVLRINGFSIIVTRGLKDSIQQTSLPLKFTRGLKCKNGVCQCTRKNFSTYIFDDTLLKGKCIKDYEIIKDRSRGKFLPGKKTKCIGINRKGKIANMSCKVDNLSVQWIWTMDEQMLNLKTLTCLRGDIIMKGKKRKKRVTEKLSLERCDFRAQKQKWTCTQPNSTTVRNKGSVNFTSKWINRSDDSYFQNCTPQENSYKGCYLFSDGNHMKLIDSEGCDNRHDGTCGQDIQIQAPIGIGYTSCELDWTNSSYAISGYRWYNFNGTAIEGIELNSSLYPSTLQIKNTSYLSKWKGHLLRLNIICTNNVRGGSESHCALLKVKGTATEEIPDPRDPRPTAPIITTPLTSIITSQPVPSTMVSRPPSSTNTSYTDFNSENRGSSADDPSIILPIAIAAGVVACLLLVAVAIMIIRKRRRKNADITQNEEHIYEEPYPVDNGPASPIYMEIDDTLTRIKSKKFDSGQNTKTSEKCETSESCEEPKDNPLYHTLEKDAVVVEVHDDDGIYDEVELVETPPADADFEKELNVSADADFEKELDV